MGYKKPPWLTFKNPYLFTILTLGLFIGFWLGFFVFAQVHIIVVCQPSGRTILDTKRSLNHEFILSANVAGCERIDLKVSKPKFVEMIFSGDKTVYQEENLEIGSLEQGGESLKGGGGGEIPQPNSAGLPLREDEPQGKRVLTLDVFGLCSGKTNISAQYFGASDKCFVKDVLPYYIIVERDNSTISTRFYEGVGFTESHKRGDYVLIFRLFAKDLSTINEDVQIIKAFGPLKDYFEIGGYSIEDVSTPEGVEKVLVFPLFMKDDIPKSAEWSQLSFYLYMSENIYYIGDLWVYVA